MSRYIYILLTFFLVAGCSSPQSKFYYLSSTTYNKPHANVRKPHKAILVAPIKLPAYLEASQIVTQIKTNQLYFDEFHRWAEPVEDNIQQVLSKNLTQLLPRYYIMFLPQLYMEKFQYRVSININQFYIDANQDAVLDVDWSIFRGEDNLKRQKHSRFMLPVNSHDKNAQVSRMSELLGRLCQAIATSI